jgi:hypothetical protein
MQSFLAAPNDVLLGTVGALRSTSMPTRTSNATRDWPAIEAWARGVAEQVGAREPAPAR